MELNALDDGLVSLWRCSGEGGGGIATADGTRPFGVAKEGRPERSDLGVPSRGIGFGVVVTLPGLVSPPGECEGLKLVDGGRIGLEVPMLGLEGLAGARIGDLDPLADSCCAVIPTYLLARLPAVILLIAEADGVSKRGGGGGMLDPLDGTREGVWKPRLVEGVMRPLRREGVTLPFANEGVTRPPKEGVIRPDIDALDEATDEGLE